MTPASSSWSGRWRRPVLGSLRVAVLVLPLWWLSQRVDIDSVLRGVERVGPGRLALGLALHLCVMTLVSFRWRILLATYRAVRLPSVAYLLRANLVANYFGLLPIPGADEGVRVLRTLPFFAAGELTPYLALLAERLTGLTGLLLVALLGSVTSGGDLAETSRHGLTLGCLLALALALPVLALPSLSLRWPTLHARVASVPLIGKHLARLEQPRRRSDLALAVLLSSVAQLGWCTVIAILFRVLDPSVTLAVCMRVQPLVLLAMTFPITPAGIGQRELVFATLYGFAGVDPIHAVTVALLSFSLGLAQQAIGGLTYAIERVAARRISAA